MEEELPDPVRLLSVYFAVKGLGLLIGMLLFYVFGYLWESLFSFFFGLISIHSTSILISILLIISYFVVAFGLRVIAHWSRIGAVLLASIGLLAFPIGTIISTIILIYLLMPSVSRVYGKVSIKNIPYRAFGIVLFAVGILIFSLSSGILESASQSFKGFSLSTADYQEKILVDKDHGSVDVIIELTASPDMAIKQQQNVIPDIVAFGGVVTSRYILVVNALKVTIDADKLDDIARNGNVKRIYEDEPIGRIYSDVVYGLGNTHSIVNVDGLWADGVTGEDVVVAIMDTGINEDHPYLQRDGHSVVIDSHELYGDWVHWHGTACAGCVASQKSDAKGIAYGADILDVEIFQWIDVDDDGEDDLVALLSDILDGWEWIAQWKATHDRFVISSNSFGIIPLAIGCGGWRNPCIVCEAANNLCIEHDIPVVVAAGNADNYFWEGYNVCCPGQAEYVLTVGAVDDNKNIASFSSVGPTVDRERKPDVVAPGVEIDMLHSDGGMVTASGTSFSCPITAGVLALGAQNHKSHSATQFYDAMRESADDLGPHGFDYSYGYGLVDGERFVLALDNKLPRDIWGYFAFGIAFAGLGIVFYPEWGRRFKELYE